jgi:hypothetical protein
VSQQHSVTCDICGATTEVSGDSSGLFGACEAPGWLRVIGAGPVITGATPREHRSRQPDLCSWKCVASYAARRAGLEPPR